MADITLTTFADNVSYDCRTGDLYFPYIGNWTSHLILTDQPSPTPTGQVKLSFHGLTLTGYILRSGISEGEVSVLVVGGVSGGFWMTIPAKYYDHQVSVRLPLGEILFEAGEVLSNTSTSSILQTTLPSWPRRQDEAGHLLDTLSDAAQCIWRVLADGSVFFGTDTFPPVMISTAGGVVPWVADVDYVLRRTDPEWMSQEIAPLTAPALFPGLSFTAAPPPDPSSAPGALGRIGSVHYQDDGTDFLARIWYLDSGQTDDSLVAGFRSIVQEELRGTTYYPMSAGQVVQQRGNGTLDVIMDDKRLPPLTSVPYLVPVPGASLTIDPGSRIWVAFAGGDPRYPTAQLYESGSGLLPVGRVGDHVGGGVLTAGVVAAMGITTVSLSYTDADGAVVPLLSMIFPPGSLTGSTPAANAPPVVVPIREKILEGSPNISLP